MFIWLEVRLPVIQFQKEKIPRNQLTEHFQLCRVIPIYVSMKGPTLVCVLNDTDQTIYINKLLAL